MVLRLHMDGNPTALLPDIIAMSVDVLHPLEPCDGGVDIYAIKETFGHRIALWGNIDVAGVLTHGSPEDVRADTIRHMEQLAGGGGYIVGSSHDLNETVPLENVYALRDAVHEFRYSGSQGLPDIHHGRCMCD
jgi:uroporphyrinogen decarboxylase